MILGMKKNIESAHYNIFEINSINPNLNKVIMKIFSNLLIDVALPDIGFDQEKSDNIINFINIYFLLI